MFTAFFTTMVPQSVTQKGVAWTQAALEAPTYFRARVVEATTRVCDRVVGAITPVHLKMKRVHQGAIERDIRAKNTRDNEIMAVVERSPTVTALCARVQALAVVCLILMACNALLVFKLSFC